jgi:hypothetical protein
VWDAAEQEPILDAGRLALGAVRYHDGVAQAPRGHGTPLDRRREPGAAPAPEPTALQLLQQLRAAPAEHIRWGTPLVKVLGHGDSTPAPDKAGNQTTDSDRR